MSELALSSSEQAPKLSRDPDPVTYSIDETARMMRINRKTVIAMIERGEFPSVRYARRRWIPARAVREFLLLDEPQSSA